MHLSIRGVQNLWYMLCTMCSLVPLPSGDWGERVVVTATWFAMLLIIRWRDRWSGFMIAAPGHIMKSSRLSMGMGIFLLLEFLPLLLLLRPCKCEEEAVVTSTCEGE